MSNFLGLNDDTDRTKDDSSANALNPKFEKEANTHMSRNQILGLLGTSILFVGAFAPIVSVPIVGSLNYFQNGRGDGVLLVLLAIISLVLTIGSKYRGLIVTGCLSLALLAYSFISIQLYLSEMQSKVQTELANNPFAGLGQTLLGTIQLQWGWAVLIIGSLILVTAGITKSSASSGEESIFGPLGEKLQNDKVSAALVTAIAAGGIVFALVSFMKPDWPPITSLPIVRSLIPSERTKDEINDAVAIGFRGKSFHSADYKAGIYHDEIYIDLELENKGTQAITAVKGTIQFNDIEGNLLRSSKFDMAERIEPGKKFQWEGSLDYNQFSSGDKKLRDSQTTQVRFKFIPESLTFADRSKIEVGT